MYMRDDGTDIGAGGGFAIFLCVIFFFDLGKFQAAVASKTSVPPRQEIKKAQQALYKLKYYSGPIDGIPTKPARDSIREFQKINGLPPTGFADAQTVNLASQLALAPEDSPPTPAARPSETPIFNPIPSEPPPSSSTTHSIPATPPSSIKLSKITISGVGSGGYMAAQLQSAISSFISGVAIISAGPVGCSRGSARTAANACSCPSESGGWLGATEKTACTPLTAEAVSKWAIVVTEGMRGLIDDISNIKHHRIWLFSGGQDRTVPPSMLDALQQYYTHYGVPSTNIKRVHTEISGHGLPSNGASELLKWLYNEPHMEATTANPTSLKIFNQRPYKDSRFNGLDETGWIYIPAACQERPKGCKIHLALHGCKQNNSILEKDTFFGLQFVKNAGYNEWAEANRIVVLYPQIKPSKQGSMNNPYRYNPMGCWDFWGYTNPMGPELFPRQPSFIKKDGAQIEALKKMIEDLSNNFN